MSFCGFFLNSEISDHGTEVPDMFCSYFFPLMRALVTSELLNIAHVKKNHILCNAIFNKKCTLRILLRNLLTMRL